MSEKRKWVITSAWPYVNAIPHLGNMIGSVLSSDAFARYLRLKGDEVVFVSGSDSHGTPVAVAAKKANIPVEELAISNHKKISDLFKKWNISYDNYTITHNETHIEFVRDFYKDVQKNGYIFEKEIESLFCERDKLYLPDRFVEGECPHCGFENARGDQCDNCQKLLTPLELKSPKCAICNETPYVKKTKHWYMDFPKLQEKLSNLIKNNDKIPQNARQMCLNSISEGIPARAITRDLEWGIPAPFKGAEGKSIYVWFEAVLGYVSAVKEWADNIVKDPKKFDYFWKDSSTRTVYFIGKDNIIFHLIVFPGLLLAYNEDKNDEDKFVLPYNVSSTEWLMYENQKFSKSRGVGIWIDDALKLAPLDYWRFNLLFNRPEKSDTSFLWSEFENSIKNLNDIIGNFVHRTLTFIQRQYNSQIPQKMEYDDIDYKFVEKINGISKKVGDLLENFELKNALREIINFAKEGNAYLNDKAPWHLIKKEKNKAGQVFYVCAQAVYALAILLNPFIPATTEKIYEYLGLKNSENMLMWDSIGDATMKEGHKIKSPKPLFQKLDISKMKEKLEILKKGSEVDLINYEYFKKLDIRVALVKKIEKVPKADKLYKLEIYLGNETRTLVAGLAEHYDNKELLGKKIVVLTNLEPRKLRGITSQGMLLAAVKDGNVSVLTVDKDIDLGAKVE